MDETILGLATTEQEVFATGIVLVVLFVLAWYGLPTFIKSQGRDRRLELDQIELNNDHHKKLLSRIDAIETDAKNLRAANEQERKDKENFRELLDECKRESAENIAKSVAAVRQDMQAIVDKQSIEISNLKVQVKALEDALAEKSLAIIELNKKLDESKTSEQQARIDASYLKGQYNAVQKEVSRLYELLAGFQKHSAQLINGNDQKEIIKAQTPFTGGAMPPSKPSV